MPHRRFPFKAASESLPKSGLDCHLVYTVIPGPLPQGDSLGVFPDGGTFFLASFAIVVSAKAPRRPGPSQPKLPGAFARPPPQSLKAGYTVRSFHHAQVLTQAVVNVSPRTWVSAEAGSTPACRCRSPHFLNSQHQPPTGRWRPAPGTSSMCP